MKETEYGGSDTTLTAGIQPAPHQANAREKLRAIYREDPDTGESTIPGITNIMLGEN